MGSSIGLLSKIQLNFWTYYRGAGQVLISECPSISLNVAISTPAARVII